MIALVDVEFEDGRIKDWEKLFKVSRPGASSLMPYKFLEGYHAYFQDELYRDGFPKHPFRHAFLPNITKPEEYRDMTENYNLPIYVTKINQINCTLVPCTQDDVDKISQYVSEFEHRYGTTSAQSGCVVS